MGVVLFGHTIDPSPIGLVWDQYSNTDQETHPSKDIHYYTNEPQSNLRARRYKGTDLGGGTVIFEKSPQS
jgi:hypothetical protein